MGRIDKHLRFDETCFIHNNAQITLEWLAVLSSQKIGYRLSQVGRTWRIEVEAPDFHRAAEQIKAYENERKFYKKNFRNLAREEIIPVRLGRSWRCLVVTALLALFYLASGPRDAQTAWFKAGAMDVEPFFAGQWWRGLTALTLHADLAHLLGNMLFLFFFSSSLADAVGPGLAWLLILLSGFMGNLGAAHTYGPWGHSSVGASTAVFGALGAIGALRVLEKLKNRVAGRSLIPILAAIAILAFTGVAEGADLVAHLTGFLSGAVLGSGVFFCHSEQLKKSLAIQTASGILAASALAAAWLTAIQSFQS